MREIITLQLGQQANYLATHFWNTQASILPFMFLSLFIFYSISVHLPSPTFKTHP